MDDRIIESQSVKDARALPDRQGQDRTRLYKILPLVAYQPGGGLPHGGGCKLRGKEKLENRTTVVNQNQSFQNFEEARELKEVIPATHIPVVIARDAFFCVVVTRRGSRGSSSASHVREDW
jgi:hypothetical protein